MEATDQTVHSSSLDGAREWFAEKGLVRRRGDRVLGGVAGAFARRFKVDRLVMRVATVGAVLLTTPLSYIALWILMPFED